jgi:hypothetical protein
MKLISSAGCILLASGLMLAGCSGAEDGAIDDPINTNPSSLAEANAEMDQIDRIMEESGSTPELVEMQRLIRDRIDVFSGLVDRIEIAPGHTVNFFVAANGGVIVTERTKIGDQSVVQSNAPQSMAALYARLAPGRAVPAALEKMAELQTSALATGPSQEGNLMDGSAPAQGGIATEQSALTDSAADGLWFVDNHCNKPPPGGTVVFRGACVIDKIGNRYSQSTSTHSIATVAFTRGSGSIFLRARLSENGPVFWEQRYLQGELSWSWTVGPWKDVRDSGCWPPPFACGTHREAQPMFVQWKIEGASGKKYNMTTLFYNDPHSWNGP